MDKNINIKDYTLDQTVTLRDAFESEGVSKVIFPKEKYILAEGLLPVDEDKFDRWKQGDYGIVRLEDKDNITVEGNNSTVYVTKQAVPDLDIDGDHIDDSEPGYRDLSHRSFYRLVNSNNITFNNANVRANNHTPWFKPNRPEYDWKWEFEHFVRIQDCKNLIFNNCNAKYIWGDGVYISGNKTENITIKDLTVDWNGRQGIAIAEGKNILIDGLKILNSRRGGVDLEAPLSRQETDGVVIQNSYLNTHLQAFPMAGSGRVDNVLIKNNTFNSSNITLCRAAESIGSKRGYIFSDNTNLGRGGAYNFVRVNDILIEKESGTRKVGKEKVVMLMDCTNVTIRNNNWQHEDGRDLIVQLRGTTKVQDVKIYGNSSNIVLKQYETGEVIPYTEYEATEEEATSIPFEVSEFVSNQYYNGEIKEVIPENYSPIGGDEFDVTKPQPEIPEFKMDKVNNLELQYKTEKNVRFKWDEVEGASKYLIKRSKDGGKVYEHSTEHTYYNLIGGNAVEGVYHIEVRATDGKNISEPSFLEIPIVHTEIEEPEVPEIPVEPKPEIPKDTSIKTEEEALDMIHKALEFLKKKKLS